MKFCDLCDMFIKSVQKKKAGADVSSLYYRLCESYRMADGKIRQRMIMALGYLEELPGWPAKRELCECINSLVFKGQTLITENPLISKIAQECYEKLIREGRLASIHENEFLRKEEEKKAQQERERLYSELVSINTVKNLDPRTIGAEHVCLSMIERLGIEPFLSRKGWKREDIQIAKAQISARAIFPCSEYKTVSFLRENSALCEMLSIDPKKITKDKLYSVAKRLYEYHTELENMLSNRVRNLFQLENRILLFDLTNTYFEGRMRSCPMAKFGRSKEKRSDCRIVVLAAVVNTDGLLVRTQIFEGNRSDVSTLQEIVESFQHELPSSEKKVVVMDAGISSKENIEFLKSRGYSYITVARSSQLPKVQSLGLGIKTIYDTKKQPIRLERVQIQGSNEKYLLVNSAGKSAKEEGMYKQASSRYEELLEAVKSGVSKKGGTKKRDAVNLRLGRAAQRFPSVHRNYNIKLKYDDKDNVIYMHWSKDFTKSHVEELKNGKYLLQTDLDDTVEENIWMFYNVIREVENTFRVLKSDLEIRPVYHKSEDGTKAHLHLAILAYWLVSTTRYTLKQKGIHQQWTELVRILSRQVVVSTRATRVDGSQVELRQCTEPPSEIVEIYSVLVIKKEPIKKRKFVWHPDPPEKKGIIKNQELNST